MYIHRPHIVYFVKTFTNTFTPALPTLLYEENLYQHLYHQHRASSQQLRLHSYYAERERRHVVRKGVRKSVRKGVREGVQMYK